MTVTYTLTPPSVALSLTPEELHQLVVAGKQDVVAVFADLVEHLQSIAGVGK